MEMATAAELTYRIFISIAIGVIVGFALHPVANMHRELWEKTFHLNYFFPFYKIDMAELQWIKDELHHTGCSSMTWPIVRKGFLNRCAGCNRRVSKQEIFALKLVK